jgi:hypothetical protein
MIDMEFVQVITAVTHAPFLQHFFCQINHISRVVRPVAASVDEQNIELFTVIPELLSLCHLRELTVSAGALRALFWGVISSENKATNIALPGFAGLSADRFRFPGCSNRHAGIPPHQEPGIPDRDIPSHPVYRHFFR